MPSFSRAAKTSCFEQAGISQLTCSRRRNIGACCTSGRHSGACCASRATGVTEQATLARQVHRIRPRPTEPTAPGQARRAQAFTPWHCVLRSLRSKDNALRSRFRARRGARPRAGAEASPACGRRRRRPVRRLAASRAPACRRAPGTACVSAFRSWYSPPFVGSSSPEPLGFSSPFVRLIGAKI